MTSPQVGTGIFNGCWAKVRRAREHRDAIEKYIGETLSVEESRPRLGIKFERETGDHVVYVNWMPDLTGFLERTSLLLGDAIHNLHSALDFLVYQLALKNVGGQFPGDSRECARRKRRVQFPIEDNPDVFEERCTAVGRPGWIADLCPEDQAVIKKYQPCDGRNSYARASGTVFDPLMDLKILSNRDKHRLLTPTLIPPTEILMANTAAAMVVEHHIRRDSNHGIKAIRTSFVELGARLFWARIDGWPETDMDMAGYIDPYICLRDGRPIVELVDRIAPVVVKIMSEFDPIPEGI